MCSSNALPCPCFICNPDVEPPEEYILDALDGMWNAEEYRHRARERRTKR